MNAGDARPAGNGRVRWLFCLAVLVWLATFALAPQLFRWIGVNRFGVWFMDLYAILASNDAVGVGLDPYVPNPLDPLKRPHVYSHWWLHLRDLGFGRPHTFTLGFGLVAAFVVTALAGLRPRHAREAIWYFLLFASPAILLGLDRANNDLVVFLLLAPVVPSLLQANRLVRLIPALLIVVATALKFYPAAAAFVLLLAVDPREVRVALAAVGMMLAVIGVDVARDLALIGHNLPRADGLITFGAVNLLEFLGLKGREVVLAEVALVAGAAFMFLRVRWLESLRIPAEDRGPWLAFALGAVLLTACFFVGTSYAYRWIFALWMAPLLWRLPRDPAAAPGVRRLAHVTSGLLLFALWFDLLVSGLLTAFRGRFEEAALTRIADRVFLCEQPLTWALFACLLAFLVAFARDGIRTLFRRA